MDNLPSRGVVELSCNGVIFAVDLEIVAAGANNLLRIRGITAADGTAQQFPGPKDKLSREHAVAFGTQWGASAAPTFPPKLEAKPPAKQTQPPKTPEAYEVDRANWDAAGGVWGLPVGMWLHLATLKKGVSVLEIGTGQGIAATDRSKHADGPRTLITHKPPRYAYTRPVATHGANWRPPYGTLYNMIILTEEVDWDIAPNLAPGGDVFISAAALVGDYADKLAEMLGYKANRVPDAHGGLWVAVVAPPEPIGEGPGAYLVDDLKAMGMPACQQCHNLARKMNKWFAADGTLEPHMNEIVKDMLPRAQAWWDNTGLRQKLKSWWHGNNKLVQAEVMGIAAATGDIDYALGESIRRVTREAERRWVADHPVESK